MAEIHPSAHVGKGVVLGEGTTVGPGAVIEDGVVLGARNTIWANAYLGQHTTLGDDNHVHPGAVIGHLPQDVGFDPKTVTFTRIGNKNVFREHCTIHRATKAGQATTIGDSCYFMAGTHVAHDCTVGNKVILVNHAALTGHCVVHDGVIMSGHTGIHQFCRIGKWTMLSALSVTNKDLPPFFIFGGRPAAAQGVNVIGLRRNGVKPAVRLEIKRAFRALYREGRTLPEAIAVIEKECPSEECRYLLEFVKASKRGIAASAREQTETLKPHFTKGGARRGAGETDEGDDTEVPEDQLL